MTAIAYPGTYNETNPYHLLSETDNKSTDLGGSTLGLINRDRHAHETDSPARKNSSNKHHGKVVRGSLEDATNGSDNSTDLNSLVASKSVHGESSHEGTKDGASRECGIDGTNNG